MPNRKKEERERIRNAILSVVLIIVIGVIIVGGVFLLSARAGSGMGAGDIIRTLKQTFSFFPSNGGV